MPFEPAFMRSLPEFKAALAEVRTTDQWMAFKRHWFADQPWPHRAPEVVQSLGPGELVEAGGRTFRRAPLPDDLTPEARYEYFAALQAGFSALFPPAEAPGAPGVKVRVQCPACELWSDDEGGLECPVCARTMLQLRLDPPRRG
ncbi:MAG: hypothetical protein IPO09_01680 [Anaeromyxobacter sp.]|nr:hypothetical protein [Anaeromyxobacter sp.]MBL0278129.1 hypothetical protein [Anaeromyxobacter sp.]